MTEDELQALLEKTLPPADLSRRLRRGMPGPGRAAALFTGGPGRVDDARRCCHWSTPRCAPQRASRQRVSHLNVTVLRTAQLADVIALSRVIRRDGDSVHAETWLFSHAVVEPMLHATATLLRRL